MSQKRQVRIAPAAHEMLGILAERLGMNRGEVVLYLAQSAVGEWPPVGEVEQSEINYRRCMAHLRQAERLWPEGLMLFGDGGTGHLHVFEATDDYLAESGFRDRVLATFEIPTDGGDPD